MDEQQLRELIADLGGSIAKWMGDAYTDDDASRAIVQAAAQISELTVEDLRYIDLSLKHEGWHPEGHIRHALARWAELAALAHSPEEAQHERE